MSAAAPRCEMCGKTYVEYKPGSPQRWCSVACRERNHSRKARAAMAGVDRLVHAKTLLSEPNRMVVEIAYLSRNGKNTYIATADCSLKPTCTKSISFTGAAGQVGTDALRAFKTEWVYRELAAEWFRQNPLDCEFCVGTDVHVAACPVWIKITKQLPVIR